MTTDEFQMTPGSKYRVRSFLTREQVLETEGVFKGVTVVGSADGIVMEVPGKGGAAAQLRVIPTHMVVAIDILESVKAVEKKTVEENVHYG